MRFQLVSVMHSKDLRGLASLGTMYRPLDGVEGDRQPDILGLTLDNAHEQTTATAGGGCRVEKSIRKRESIRSGVAGL